MSDGQKKKGRPPAGEARKKMKLIAFKADAETEAALDELVEKQRRITPPGHSKAGLQSAAVRHAILFTAGKIDVS